MSARRDCFPHSTRKRKGLESRRERIIVAHHIRQEGATTALNEYCPRLKRSASIPLWVRFRPTRLTQLPGRRFERP